jgi:hypothetical protein
MKLHDTEQKMRALLHCDFTAKRWYQIVEHIDVEHPEQQSNTIEAL